MGSLIAAVASYLACRQAGLDWLIRIDDLDTPRNVAGAETAILQSLAAHGFPVNKNVERQSARIAEYEAALESLKERLFYCRCTRKQTSGRVYPGTCRSHQTPLEDAAVRLLVGDTEIAWTDLVQGAQHIDARTAIGDFIVRRRDGIIAYNLACAVDDGDPQIVQVVRGADLLATTAVQLIVMDALALDRPAYGHIPVLLGADGHKLSKQTKADPLNDAKTASNIRIALTHLGLPTADATPAPKHAQDWLAWGEEHFAIDAVAKRTTITQG